MTGSGTSSKARNAAARMRELVPRWYWTRNAGGPGTLTATETGVLAELLEVLGAGLDAARADIERLLDDLFIETCNPRLIPLIGDLVGVSVDPHVPVARQRHMVKYAIHLRRRKGTIEQLQVLGWQLTGFETRVIEATACSDERSRPRCTPIVSGKGGSIPAPRTAMISGAVPTAGLRIEVRVAWPVRRGHRELVKVGPDIHAVHATRAVGLRRSDGTPILTTDDPSELVGAGRAIEVTPVGADAALLGPLRPIFMDLGSAVPPAHVPHHSIAIDPERGRVAGPTAPTPGIQYYRRYRLDFWEPLRALWLVGPPSSRGGGIFAFSQDNQPTPLTDAQGVSLVLFAEGECDAPAPSQDQRLLVVREVSWPRDRYQSPFLVLPPGEPYNGPEDAEAKGLALDLAGLKRFFSIEDEWGWDAFSKVLFVTRFVGEPPPDDTVEIDLARGLFRVGPAHQHADFTVRHYRPYDVRGLQVRLEEELRYHIPLGRSASFVFLDTAPGLTRVSER
jgi:Phage tail protein (Tail_P2_I)